MTKSDLIDHLCEVEKMPKGRAELLINAIFKVGKELKERVNAAATRAAANGKAHATTGAQAGTAQTGTAQAATKKPGTEGGATGASSGTEVAPSAPANGNGPTASAAAPARTQTPVPVSVRA
jgi:hypothetical protein